MLRHYDQLGLLKPSQTDKFTGYRYYTIDQLPRLNRILALKALGISLEQIAQLLGRDGQLSAERLRGMLELRQAEIAQEMQEKQRQLLAVEARLRQIEHEGRPPPYEVVFKSAPAMVVASLRRIVPRVDEMGFYCLTLYRQLYAELARLGITPLQPEITLYHAQEYVETDLDTEIAVPVQEKHLRSEPAAAGVTVRELSEAPLVAALVYEGPFAEMPPAVLSLLGHAGSHGYAFAGPLRELHLSGPAHTAEGQEHPAPVVELQIPIQRP
jgi:DNA-binding transcriptional MerR regulator